MKQFLLPILLFLYFFPAQAQFFRGEHVINNPNFDRERLSYGYYLGFNTYDLKFNYNEAIKDFRVDKTIGFNVGMIGNLRLNDYLDLRLEPGVIFNRIELQFDPGESESFREVNSTFVHIPLLLKFSTKRVNNFKPFIVGGVSTSWNLSSNENDLDPESHKFRMTTNSFYYEIGFGIDMYLYYFKFSPSIRGVFAINDQFVGDGSSLKYAEKIDKMTTRGIFINFTFQ